MPTYQEVFASAFEEELQKIAQSKAVGLLTKHKKELGIAAAGAVGYESLRRANEDRKMGRMVRRQNQGW